VVAIVRNLSDYIEEHIKKLLKATANDVIEIQRNQLADVFNCAPSQINYVLRTRFSPRRGYVIESQRGGGGYIRIIRLSLPEGNPDIVTNISKALVGGIDQKAASDLIARFYEEGLLDKVARDIMLRAINRDILRIELPTRDQLRSRLVRGMLLEALKHHDCEGNGNGGSK